MAQHNNHETIPNFIYDIIANDLTTKRVRQVITRFPPEPNGYLHIGHAKAIVLNFDMAAHFGGRCNLRFDDTNPTRENSEYLQAIEEDIHWLGFEYGDPCYASDYFEKLYQFAQQLIAQGDAYVDSLTSEGLQKGRGTPTEVGVESPQRRRSVAENQRLFKEMCAGSHPEGSLFLRAKINMQHPNLNMRDPVMYRILHQSHHRRGRQWFIYPLYDFAHGQSDAIEGISHSLCTLEFENHRPLYDWFLKRLKINNPPCQYEYARLNLSHTVLSKRRLQQLVEAKLVNGWDDPRLPTLRGMRRRGYPPEAICTFCRSVGVTKVESQIDMAHLEYFVREALNKIAPRVMVIINPLKVIVDNWPGEGEYLPAANNPEDPHYGSRSIKFERELYIEQEDFMMEPPPKYFRLAPGREVRLQHAYYLTCIGVERNSDNQPALLHCRYDPASRGGITSDRRKVRGTLHWLACSEAEPIELRCYERLFRVADVSAAERGGATLEELLNPHSLVVRSALAEPQLVQHPQETTYQFMRQGYYCYDRAASIEHGGPIYNQTVPLRDSWSKKK